ncbi:MAG TPA: SDR family oxidoreductase [Polyangiaceae bacterium]|nr:SDR family oxidoreductase [Polyangiaceae bacterium]
MTNAGAPVTDAFRLDGRVIVITGGAGLLGRRHAEAIAEAGGIPVLGDLDVEAADRHARALSERTGVAASAVVLDVTSKESCERALETILARHGRLDGLVNNAARNPKVEDGSIGSTRFETLSLATWSKDLDVGLTGAFLASQVFGGELAKRRSGVIVNIASDLAVISPDQRLYRKPGLPESEQPVKPVTYSVIKAGLAMMTKYLATYWAEAGVRVNALSPGGVYAGQPDDFVEKLATRIPMARMAREDEYKAALVFLCSDASSYMTGHNLVIDGGRTCW